MERRLTTGIANTYECHIIFVSPLNILQGSVSENLFFILFSSFRPATCGRTEPFGNIYKK